MPELYGKFFREANTPMAITDERGRLLRCNPAFCRLISYPTDELVNRNLLEFVGGEDQAAFRSVVEELRSGGDPRLEHRYISRDDRKIHARTVLSELHDGPDGQEAELAVVSEDISELVHMRSSAEILLSSASVGIWDWVDVNTDQEHWSPQFYRLLGYEPNEMSPSLESFTKLLHPDDHARTFALVEAHFEGRADFDIEYRLRTKSHGYRWFRGHAQVQRDLSGNPVRMVGSIQDIHEQRVAQDEVAALVLRHNLSLQASGIGIWDWDVVENCIVWDEQMYRLYGMRSEDWASAYEAWLSALHPADKERCQTEVAEVLEGKREFDTEFRVVWPSGEVRYLRGIAATIRDAQDQPQRMVGVNWDVTSVWERARALEETTNDLVRANEALTQSNFDLQQFAYIASHDLQTPLRNISGFAHLLEKKYEDVLDEKGRDYTARIVRGCEHMQTLIRDMLAYSRVDAKSKPFSAVDLKTIFSLAVEALSSSIEDAQSDVVVTGELPTVHGDAAQLLQLFQNIISNGIKYNRSHRPAVDVSVEYVDGCPNILFSDNGIGIAARHLDRIFELFTRLHLPAEYPGTGLGLAICKRIAERHRAELSVTSQEGGGSVFRVAFRGYTSPGQEG